MLMACLWNVGLDKVVIALIVVQWAIMRHGARTALAETQKDYIDAARVLAFVDANSVFRHLLPQLHPAAVWSLGTGAKSPNTNRPWILAVFLGVGVPINAPLVGLPDRQWL